MVGPQGEPWGLLYRQSGGATKRGQDSFLLDAGGRRGGQHFFLRQKRVLTPFQSPL